MNICGIVCEYNPFHAGHRHLIDAVRRTLGADCAVVCVMSGDFVQRGEAAAFLKHDRARAAVAGGADLVLELPLPWAIAPAEGFARGAVGALGATGVVTHIAFGSECGDLPLLQDTAGALLRPDFDALLRSAMAEGLPYAAARQQAVGIRTGGSAEVLRQPNDILAVEYLKVIRSRGLPMIPIAVKRQGGGHDTGEEDACPSAAFLREKLRAGADISPWMPAPSARALAEGEGPVDPASVETAILSRLRFVPEEAFTALPDISEGLERRIYPIARTAPTLDAAVEEASGKRYPKARVRRIMLAAALHVRAGDAAGIPPYLRVLAANGKGLALLRQMEQTAALPVLTKPAHVRTLGGEAERIFTLTAAGADLACLGLADAARRGGDRDWRAAPAICPD